MQILSSMLKSFSDFPGRLALSFERRSVCVKKAVKWEQNFDPRSGKYLRSISRHQAFELVNSKGHINFQKIC